MQIGIEVTVYLIRKGILKSVLTLCDIFGLFWNKSSNEVVREKNSIF